MKLRISLDGNEILKDCFISLDAFYLMSERFTDVSAERRNILFETCEAFVNLNFMIS